MSMREALDNLRRDPSLLHPTPNSIVLNCKELERITKLTIPSTHKIKHEISDKAKQRIQSMRKLERKKKERVIKTDEEIEKEAEQMRARKALQSRKDHNHEAVRAMSSMVAVAHCGVGRDDMIRRKQENLKREKEEEAYWHSAMMKEKESAIKAQQQKTLKLHQETMDGAKVIRKQIKENEYKRIIAQEKVAEEGEKVLEMIRKRKEEQRRKIFKEADQRKRMAAEIIEANKAAAELKRLAKEREIQEDMKIAEYIKQKDAREEEIEKQKEADRVGREYESARLRAQQERASDNRGQLDELRARRAFEQKEREWRASTLKKAAEKQKRIEELKQSRELQMRVKQSRLAREIEAQKEEFQNTVEDLRKFESERNVATAQAKREKETLCQDLQEQMRKKLETTVKEKNTEIEQIQLERRIQLQKLQQIKQEKIEEMVRMGIPEKYMSDLKNYKVTV